MSDVPGWGVVSSVAAPVLLIGGWNLAARLQPGGFDAVTGTISALAARDAEHRWVMTTALVGVGAAHITTALALRPAAVAGRWLVGVGGVATVLVAAFPLPGEEGSSTAHGVVAGIAFVSLGVWPAFSWRRRCETKASSAREPADVVLDRSEGTARPPDRTDVPAPFRPAVALTAGGLLVAGLGWFFAELLSGGDKVGLSERVAAGSQAVWPLIAVLATRRHARPSV